MSSLDYTASVITPAIITDAELVSCTVPEPAPGEVLWNAATAYVVGQVAIRTTTHRKYKRLIAGTTATPPESDTSDPPIWLDIGATNRWAQFDDKIGTQTSAADVVTTVLTPGSVEGVAILEPKGRTATLTMRARPGGPVVATRTTGLSNSILKSVYDWFFAKRMPKTNVVFTDLPGQWPLCEVEVTVSNPGGTAAVGVLTMGRVAKLGSTSEGAGAGIINWGKVQDDGFGNREFVEGPWSARITLPIVADRADFSNLLRTLAPLRSKPAVYIGSQKSELQSLIGYGVFKDLYVTVPNYALTSMNLEIEGLSNV